MKKIFISTVLVSLLFAGTQTDLPNFDDGTVFVNQQYVDNLSKGWNLIGVEHRIKDLGILKNIDLAWIFDRNTKEWKVYSPMTDIQSDIESSSYYNKLIKTIPAASGIWVYRKINLPKFKKFDYKILAKNDKEAKLRLNVDIELPNKSNNSLFYEENDYDNGKKIDLAYLPSFDENDSSMDMDVNLSLGHHTITICQGVGFSNFSPATIRYNVCKSVNINLFAENNISALYDFYGNIIDNDHSALSNVKITLQLPDKNITSITNSNGDYDLNIDKKINFPVLITASKEGYLPESVNIYKKDNLTQYKKNFILSKQAGNVVVIDKDLHHLGDDSYTGAINSQFQANAEGTIYKKDFNLTSDFINSHSNVKLSIYVKGAQYKNPIYINGNSIGYLDKSPNDGSFGKYSISISSNYLKDNNVLEIKSKYDSDYDDFEFANIQLIGK